jgi:hypothetical protein
MPFDMVHHIQPAIAEKCKEICQSMILQLNRVIRGWQRSGQGDSRFIDDEVDNEDGEENEVDDTPAHECEFGSLKNCSQLALDNQNN